MTIYHQTRGGHVHCRVFMNGSKCGDLVFRVEEFEDFRRWVGTSGFIEFIHEPTPK